jgi:hypothetical protein
MIHEVESTGKLSRLVQSLISNQKNINFSGVRTWAKNFADVLGPNPTSEQLFALLQATRKQEQQTIARQKQAPRAVDYPAFDWRITMTWLYLYFEARTQLPNLPISPELIIETSRTIAKFVKTDGEAKRFLVITTGKFDATTHTDCAVLLEMSEAIFAKKSAS